MLHSFDGIYFQRIPKSENARVDILSRLTTIETANMTKSTSLEILDALSLNEAKTIMATIIEPSWMDPLIAYFTKGHLSEDETEAQWLIKKSSHYVFHDGKLYRTSYIIPLLRCLRPSKVAYALQEVHEETCGAYQGVWSLAHKILR